MTKQTKFEKELIQKINDFSEKSGITVNQIFVKCSYVNSMKVKQFMSGIGTISMNTAGKIIDFIEMLNPEE